MSHWTARVACGLLVLLGASFCLTQLSEVDLHWHLLAGQRILQEGRVPRVDSFTYASAGRPWTDLQWLYQVLLALAYRVAGWPGLEILKVGVIVAALSAMTGAALRRGVSAGVVALLLLPSILASQERFTLRPEALSFLFLAALLLVLGERSRHPRLLLLVPPLMTLWANCHALYVVGAAVIVLTTTGDMIQRYLPTRTQDGPAPAGARSSLPSWIAIASLAATALTPYGVEGWVLPYRLLFERIAGDNVYSRSIAEFQPPFGGFAPTASIAAFALLVAIVGMASIAGRKAVSPAEALVLTALLSLALLARRNIPLFALAAVSCAAPALDATLRRASTGITRRFSRSAAAGGIVAVAAHLLVIALTLVVLADVWSNRFFVRDGTQRYFGRGWAPGFYPEGAADFVLTLDPPGEVINDMTMGGYLEWRFYPARRTFIDGRLEVHDRALFTTSLMLQSDPVVFEETARRFGARTVLWSHRHSPEAAPLLRYLAGRNGWRPIYVDMAASVFTRDATAITSPTVDLGAAALGGKILDEIHEAEARSSRLDPAPALVRRLLPREDVPVAEVNAALFFGAVDSHAIAERLFREAVRKAPANPVIHYDLGLVLERAGRTGEARREFETALGLGPSFSAAREALALRRLADGDPDGALLEWAAAERESPLASPSLVARGRLLAARGRVDEAIEDFRKAVALSPQDADRRADLALVYRQRGLKEEAAAEIRRALDLAPHGCAPLVARGRMYLADGRPDEAEQAFREALSSSDVPCPEAGRALQELRARNPSRP
jgi:Flp pilus assembly protein TadD